MATRGSYVHISMGELSGASGNISFMQFSAKIDGFEQKDSQGFENTTLFERLMEIHSNPPILYYGFKTIIDLMV